MPENANWVSIGLGNSTQTGDMFMIEHDQHKTVVTDMYYTPQGNLRADLVNDYTLKVENQPDLSIYTVERKLTTNDEQDTEVVDGLNQVFFEYGYGEAPTELSQLHPDIFVLEIARVNRNLASGPATSKTRETALLHGLFTYMEHN